MLKSNLDEEVRVLSIQSHVVHGYVGNNCAVFPLRLHGFDVDAINSVQFSNHTSYPSFKGQILDSSRLKELYQGLKANGISQYSYILTGYCADESFLKTLVDIIKDQKRINSQLIYVCDPVMGDDGQFYVPKILLPIYRDFIIPLSDVVTPNQFELGQIANISITTEDECLQAIDYLHSIGPRFVVVTSSQLCPDVNKIFVYASQKSESSIEHYRFIIDRFDRQFVGTGDLFASLLLVWLHRENRNLCVAVENVLQTLQSVLKNTLAKADKAVDPRSFAASELALIQSRYDLLNPPNLGVISKQL